MLKSGVPIKKDPRSLSFGFLAFIVGGALLGFFAGTLSKPERLPALELVAETETTTASIEKLAVLSVDKEALAALLEAGQLKRASLFLDALNQIETVDDFWAVEAQFEILRKDGRRFPDEYKALMERGGQLFGKELLVAREPEDKGVPEFGTQEIMVGWASKQPFEAAALCIEKSGMYWSSLLVPVIVGAAGRSLDDLDAILYNVGSDTKTKPKVLGKMVGEISNLHGIEGLMDWTSAQINTDDPRFGSEGEQRLIEAVLWRVRRTSPEAADRWVEEQRLAGFDKFNFLLENEDS